MKVEIHEILKFVRQKAKKSQEELAFLLQVDVKTIRKWETGKSEPPCSKVIEWFRGVGMNPIPYLLIYAYPNDFKLEEMQDADKIAKLYELITENLTIEDKKALVQIFSGMHGSSPSSVIQLMLAHLSNPLLERIYVAEFILEQYRFNHMNDEENYHPNIEMLERAVQAAKEAVEKGDEGYINTMDDV